MMWSAKCVEYIVGFCALRRSKDLHSVHSHKLRYIDLYRYKLTKPRPHLHSLATQVDSRPSRGVRRGRQLIFAYRFKSPTMDSRSLSDLKTWIWDSAGVLLVRINSLLRKRRCEIGQTYNLLCVSVIKSSERKTRVIPEVLRRSFSHTSQQ